MSNSRTEWLPQDIDDVTAAFPASVKSLMPEWGDIPDEFKRWDHPWSQWQAQWFYSGLENYPKPRPGIDANKAMRHLATIQRSFEPKHEHKSAAVAYLASLWFVKPVMPRTRKERKQ